MTAEPWQWTATGFHPPLPAIASQWDRTCLDPGKPTPQPCGHPGCAELLATTRAELHAYADREQQMRHHIDDITYELATANRELARLRRQYEPTDEGER